MPLPNAKFELGQTVATPGALEALDQNGIAPIVILARHVAGDWGVLDAHDTAANEAALMHAARILSSYPLPDGGKVWCITERDRSVTTILLPSEY